MGRKNKIGLKKGCQESDGILMERNSSVVALVAIFLTSARSLSFSIFIFPCVCFDGADPRHNLVDQRDAAVRNRCCSQAQYSSTMGQSTKAWQKNTQEDKSHHNLPSDEIDS